MTENAVDLSEIMAVMGPEVESAAGYDMRDKPRSRNDLASKSVSGTALSLRIEDWHCGEWTIDCRAR